MDAQRIGTLLRAQALIERIPGMFADLVEINARARLRCRMPMNDYGKAVRGAKEAKKLDNSICAIRASCQSARLRRSECLGAQTF
jgi:hypothetical protein